MVKVVVQHKKTFQYVQSETDWTDDAFKAHNFERVHSAAEFCHKNKLRQVYVVCGEFNSESKRFNAATKTILDIAQLRPQPEAIVGRKDARAG